MGSDDACLYVLSSMVSMMNGVAFYMCSWLVLAVSETDKGQGTSVIILLNYTFIV